MKTLISSLLCVAALAGRGWGSDPKTPSTGKVLILENERTLEGDVEKVGQQYRVRRTIGETWVPAENVLALCQSLEEAYALLRSRSNLNDADEHLRLSQWCRLHGLRDQALAEIKAAVELRPDQAESRRLLSNLQKAALVPPAPALAPVERREPNAALPIDLTARSMGLFVARVQPILMNACVRCHSAGRGGSFQLTRTNDGAAFTRKTMHQNLAAVIAQVSPAQPELSPLLTKAVAVHGDLNQSPLRDRKTAAYQTLEEWVLLTVATNPHLKDHPGVATVTLPQPEAKNSTFASLQAGAAPADEAPRAPALPAPPTLPAAATKPAAEEPADPFDPAIFNRLMHPQKTPPAPAGPKP